MRLVSYQRDLWVWMFPGVRRNRVVLAIAISCTLSLYKIIFFESFNYCLRHKILLAARAMAYKKPPTTVMTLR